MSMWNSNIFYEKLLDGWERSETSNGLPYYINHHTQQTEWDHPILSRTFEELGDMNSIRYAAYRTAMKLRFLQKRIGFDQVSIHALQTVLERRGLAKGVDTVVDCVDLYGILIDVLQVAKSTAQNLTTEQQAEIALNLLLNLYDVNRTGCVRLVSVKIGIATICSARLSEKYRYFFNQFADNTNHLTRKAVACLLHDLIQIPEVMNESQPFGGLNVSAAVESCFSMVWGSIGASEDVFLSWLLREPQTLVWLPTMHRLAAAESVKHESKCNVCKVYPIVGFRYKCLKCFNYDMCQQCFFTGRLSKSHKFKHPTQEYCVATTSKDDTKAFIKTLRNNLSKKHRNKQKLRYLPIYGGGADGNKESEPAQEDMTPPDMHAIMAKKANSLSEHVQISRNASDRSDVMGKVRRHPRQEDPKARYDDDSPRDRRGVDRADSLQLGNNRRRELESVIQHLENENRELMYEIERLYQHRSDSGSELGSEDYRRHVDANDQPYRGYGGDDSQYEDQERPPMAHQEVLKAHNQQLEMQLQKLRHILKDDSREQRGPLRPVSPNVPPQGRRSRPLISAVMTPPRVLQQPPPYSERSTTPKSYTPTRPLGSPFVRHSHSPGPRSSEEIKQLQRSYEDQVDSQLANMSYDASFSEIAADTSFTSMDGALSRTRFSLPSMGQSQYLPDEEAELAELIERLDEVYPADNSHSVFDRDSSTMKEMGRATNQMGEAFNHHPLEGCQDDCGRRQRDYFSDGDEPEMISNKGRVNVNSEQVYISSRG